MINNNSIKGHTVKNNRRSRDPKEPIGNAYYVIMSGHLDSQASGPHFLILTPQRVINYVLLMICKFKNKNISFVLVL
jgi:hypothetical protein